jgi:hypothetical protein
MAGACNVLADVDGPVAMRDVGDDDVQTFPAGQARVDERAGQVEATARRLEHLLHQVADLARGQDGRGELRLAPTGDEDLRWRVDPDLLDLGVVEVLLQRSETGDGVNDRLQRPERVGERRDRPDDAPPVVVGERIGDEILDAPAVADGIDAAAADELADLGLEDGHAFHRHPRLLRRPTRARSNACLEGSRCTRCEPGRTDSRGQTGLLAPVCPQSDTLRVVRAISRAAPTTV